MRRMSQRKVEKVRKYRLIIHFKSESIRYFPFNDTNVVLLLFVFYKTLFLHRLVSPNRKHPLWIVIYNTLPRRSLAISDLSFEEKNLSFRFFLSEIL